MNKKHTIFALLLLLISIGSIAQERKIEFGLAAGYGTNVPKIKGTNSPNLKGYHAGILLSYNINESIGIQTGTLYNHFGGVNIDFSQQTLKKSLGVWNQKRTTYTALDIPIKVVYSYMLAEDFYLQISGGPNLNYALEKKTNIEKYVENKLSNEEKGTDIYQTADYNRLDLQLGVGIGIQWMGIGIRGSYDWGVLNRTQLISETYRANDLKITLSYKF